MPRTSATLETPSLDSVSTQDLYRELIVRIGEDPTRDGLVRRSADGQLDVYTENAAVLGSLPGKKLFDVLRDREGGRWFATGVARTTPTS